MAIVLSEAEGSRAGKYMLAEHPVVTTERFIRSLQATREHPQRIAENLQSISNESHRRFDNFHLIVKNDELIDPATGKIIDFQRKTWLQILEGQVWDELKWWANNCEEGSATWKSPKLENFYPCDKVVFYEISYTNDFPPQKILLSTAILLDTPEKNFNENIRNKLILNIANYTLIDLLEELSLENENNKKTPSQEQINYFVRKVKSGVAPELIAEEMKEKGIIGNEPLSCRRELVLGNQNYTTILDFRDKSHNWEWEMGDCVRCNKKNTEVGPCKICRKCNEELDKTEMSFAA